MNHLWFVYRRERERERRPALIRESYFRRVLKIYVPVCICNCMPWIVDRGSRCEGKQWW